MTERRPATPGGAGDERRSGDAGPRAEEWRPTAYAGYLARAAAVAVLGPIAIAFGAYGGFLIDRALGPHGETPTGLLIGIGLGSLAIALLFAAVAVLAATGVRSVAGWGAVALLAGGASAIPFAGLFGGIGYVVTVLVAGLAVGCAGRVWWLVSRARRS